MQGQERPQRLRPDGRHIRIIQTITCSQILYKLTQRDMPALADRANAILLLEFGEQLDIHMAAAEHGIDAESCHYSVWPILRWP